MSRRRIRQQNNDTLRAANAELHSHLRYYLAYVNELMLFAPEGFTYVVFHVEN